MWEIVGGRGERGRRAWRGRKRKEGREGREREEKGEKRRVWEETTPSNSLEEKWRIVGSDRV